MRMEARYVPKCRLVSSSSSIADGYFCIIGSLRRTCTISASANANDMILPFAHGDAVWLETRTLGFGFTIVAQPWSLAKHQIQNRSPARNRRTRPVHGPFRAAV